MSGTTALYLLLQVELRSTVGARREKTLMLVDVGQLGTISRSNLGAVDCTLHSDAAIAYLV